MKPKKTTAVVLMPIRYFDRKVGERIESSVFKTIDSVREELKKKSPESEVSIYQLTDFMDACNDQEIDLESYWVTYVTIENFI